MSDIADVTPEMLEAIEARRAESARRVLSLYQAITVLMLLGIGGLALYAFRLGPLVGTGVEDSFGLAVAAMFLMGALLAHLADRTYRGWPLGRRFRPSPPLPVTPRAAAGALTWVVLLATVAGVAYVIAQLLV